MANERQNPVLLIIQGEQKEQTCTIYGDEFLIGRDPSADLVIDAAVVSRHHAQIFYTKGYWHIRDLGSKNGVFRNKVRIPANDEMILTDGDQVQIASALTFKFSDPESTMVDSHIRTIPFGLWVDEGSRDVFILGKKLDPPLSATQYKLLTALVQKEGNLITNEEINDMLWPNAAGGVFASAIDNTISRLNRRLAELDETHTYIMSIRGMGRKFVQRTKTGDIP